MGELPLVDHVAVPIALSARGATASPARSATAKTPEDRLPDHPHIEFRIERRWPLRRRLPRHGGRRRRQTAPNQRQLDCRTSG